MDLKAFIYKCCGLKCPKVWPQGVLFNQNFVDE